MAWLGMTFGGLEGDGGLVDKSAGCSQSSRGGKKCCASCASNLQKAETIINSPSYCDPELLHACHSALLLMNRTLCT